MNERQAALSKYVIQIQIKKGEMGTATMEFVMAHTLPYVTRALILQTGKPEVYTKNY